VYAVVGEEGPDHERWFRVECRLDDETVTTGEGRSKKVAEQDAARAALAKLDAGGRPRP
jgi:ribonuclease-3